MDDVQCNALKHLNKNFHALIDSLLEDFTREPKAMATTHTVILIPLPLGVGWRKSKHGFDWLPNLF